MILDERRKASLAPHLLLWLDPGVLVTVAAESAAKLHPRLGEPGTEQTVTIAEPPADPSGGTQLPQP